MWRSCRPKLTAIAEDGRSRTTEPSGRLTRLSMPASAVVDSANCVSWSPGRCQTQAAMVSEAAAASEAGSQKRRVRCARVETPRESADGAVVAAREASESSRVRSKSDHVSSMSPNSSA